MTLHIAHEGDAASRLPSAAIWGTCPVIQMPFCGYMHWDDFVQTPEALAADGNWGVYGMDISGATTLSGIDNVIGGAMGMTVGTTADQGANISSSTGPFVMHADTSALDKRDLWFECRVRKTVVTDDTVGFCIGLASPNLAVNSVMAAAGTVGVVDFFGFLQLEADGDSVDLYEAKAGEAAEQLIDGVATLTADGWKKLGFRYTPSGGGERISVYVDGVKHATTFSGSTTTAANFPDGEEMGFYMEVLRHTTNTACNVEVDWIAIAQLSA